MILIGIGGNLHTPEYGTPRATCSAAVAAMERAGLTVSKRSNWFRSSPVPVSSQSWYINGAVCVETAINPRQLLELLQGIETQFGRRRGAKNAARTLDLDLIAFGNQVTGWEDETGTVLTVPHRRLHERGFVLLPLREIAPGWRHPVLHLGIDEMIAELDPDQQCLLDDEVV